MCRREVFEKVRGFEEKLAVSFNDVDLCFKMLEEGYYNVWLPYVILYHYESKSRGDDIISPNKRARLMCEAKYLQKRWLSLLHKDPFYNQNLTLRNVDFSLNLEPLFFE
jgi:GT2 family glycosyltransferase